MHLKVEPLNSWANKPPATILSVGALPAACGQYSRARGPLTGLKTARCRPARISLGVFGLSDPMVGPKGGPYPGSRGTAPRSGRVGACGFRSGRAVIRERAHCALAGIRPLAFGLIRSRPLGRAVSSTAAHASSWHPGVSSQRWTAAVACALLDVSCIMPATPRHHVRSAQGPENLHDGS